MRAISLSRIYGTVAKYLFTYLLTKDKYQDTEYSTYHTSVGLNLTSYNGVSRRVIRGDCG